MDYAYCLVCFSSSLIAYILYPMLHWNIIFALLYFCFLFMQYIFVFCSINFNFSTRTLRTASSTHSNRSWSPSIPGLKRSYSQSRSRSRSRSLSPQREWYPPAAHPSQPLPPPMPSTAEKGVTVDLSENARPIMKEIGMLEDVSTIIFVILRHSLSFNGVPLFISSNVVLTK